MVQLNPVQQVRIATALLQAIVVAYTIWFAGVAYVFKTKLTHPELIEQQLSDFSRIFRSIALSSAALQTMLSLTVFILSIYSSPLLRSTLAILLLITGAVTRTIQIWTKRSDNDPPLGMYPMTTLITIIFTGGVIFIIFNPWLLQIL